MMTMASLVLLSLAAFAGAQQAGAPTIDELRARAQARMRQDRAVYSPDDLKALEELYQSANRDLRNPNAKVILQRVITQYPKSNRAGSAILYLAQLSSDTQKEGFLKTAIDAHGDTWYGDGVQVGAYARAQLAAFYAAGGKLADAKALAKEIMESFPGAVDHSGRPLADTLRTLGLL